MRREALTLICGLGYVCLASWAPSAAQSPTTRYGYCMAQGVQSKPYLSTTFETSWPVTVSLESRFLDFIKSKYGVTASRPYCYTHATLADAQRYRPQIVRDEAAWIAVDWRPAAAATTAAPAPTAPKPQPVAPATTASASPAPAPASTQSKSTAPATIFVICRSEWNTDLRRFYNAPVDGRAGAYPDWQESYRTFLVKTYKFKGENLSCGKYPNEAAAQADYDAWVSNARATPTVNGLASPIIVTDWKY